MGEISFGTSGWRGILSEDFIFDNVRVVTKAIADHINSQNPPSKEVIVGHDSRFMGERFAETTAEILADNNLKALLCDRDIPTPVISFEILRRKAAGGINFTASHNPYNYNGIKFSPSWGGPALPETTIDIEKRANRLSPTECKSKISSAGAKAKGLLEVIDPQKTYLEDLNKKIDFDAIKKLDKIAVNPLYGTARGYLDTHLSSLGINIKVINNHRDPYFGGFPPEPAEKNIQDFISVVKADPSIKLGIATDGDADRFGIVDSDGSYIEPNYIIALLLDYLVRSRKLTGGAARSVATSHLVDAVAKQHGIEVFETPVGFKYIGELISQDKIIIGGEESAGLSIKGHVPEKDGILACFLVAEMVAREGKSINQLLNELYDKVGVYITKRDNITLSKELETAFPKKLSAIPAEIAGTKIQNIIKIDGTKLMLTDGSWLLFRKSGTEPVVRLYGEASSEKRLEEVMKAGKEFILKPM